MRRPAEYLVTKTDSRPGTPMRGAVLGKSGEYVVPATYTLP